MTRPKAAWVIHEQFMGQQALFLDRDGVLIEDTGYVSDAASITFIPGVAGALQRFSAAGYRFVIVTNQSAIGRGLMSEAQFHQVQERILGELSAAGIGVLGSYFCPHSPDQLCDCRKPLPGMLLRASKELSLDLAHSVMIGDRTSDVEAGQTAGCRTVLFGPTPAGDDPSKLLHRPDYECQSWSEVCAALL